LDKAKPFLLRGEGRNADSKTRADDKGKKRRYMGVSGEKDRGEKRKRGAEKGWVARPEGAGDMI